MDYITIVTDSSSPEMGLAFSFFFALIIIIALVLFAAVHMRTKTKVAIGIIAVVAISAIFYQQFFRSGNDVTHDNEAEIERAYGLTAEDLGKIRSDDGDDIYEIMHSSAGWRGHCTYDTGNGLQKIIISTVPIKDSSGDLHMTLYNEDGSPIHPAPPGEKARTVGNGHIVSWSSSPKPGGDHDNDGDNGAVQGSDWDNDGVTAST